WDLAFASDGSVQKLAIDFEQHCEGFEPALFGSLRFNSSLSVVPRASVANTTGLKGNFGTSNAMVPISLSIPSSESVTIHYSTADGSARQGTDYIATSGSVTLAPGTTEQNIIVPLVGDRLARGNKTFKVLLTSANGVLLADKTGSVKIFDPNIALTAFAFSSEPGDFIGQ